MEWHDRKRDKYGRFAMRRPPEPVQFHVRMTEARADLIRRAALAAHISMGHYVAAAVDQRLTADGYLSDEAATE
jgi:predicted HicB family RNase H-like nuclease